VGGGFRGPVNEENLELCSACQCKMETLKGSGGNWKFLDLNIGSMNNS
jgi:hypothetical protein